MSTTKKARRRSRSNGMDNIRTTGIRPKTLARVNVVLQFTEDKKVVDFISNACDRRVREEVAKHNITLPPALALDATA